MLALAIAGCSDNQGKDIASCRSKAMEIFKQESVWEGKSGDYIVECMRASGYRLDRSCIEHTNVRDMSLCYYPDNWWERWKPS